jgi:ABC-type lipoprotein release transport system permease subunit
LYETSPLDPPTFLLVVVLFGACASTAALVPAMRAMRVNPVVALRYE